LLGFGRADDGEFVFKGTHLTASAKMKSTRANTDLSPKERDVLLAALKSRFEKNLSRHPGIDWTKVLAKLEANPAKLRSLQEMEESGGEPDVVAHDKKSGDFVFFDCSPESPKGRFSL
jgi:hypothetical protein